MRMGGQCFVGKLIQWKLSQLRWPLSADDWDAQLMFFLNHGYRVIAHDRRGHGRANRAPVNRRRVLSSSGP